VVGSGGSRDADDRSVCCASSHSFSDSGSN
jgi:hypothetical protein